MTFRRDLSHPLTKLHLSKIQHLNSATNRNQLNYLHRRLQLITTDQAWKTSSLRNQLPVSQTRHKPQWSLIWGSRLIQKWAKWMAIIMRTPRQWHHRISILLTLLVYLMLAWAREVPLTMPNLICQSLQVWCNLSAAPVVRLVAALSFTKALKT